MKIINKEIEIVHAVGLQIKNNSKHYRWMNYTVLSSMKDGILLHNVLTKELLFLTQQELETLNMHDYLISHWYMVPDDFDDMSFYNQILSLISLFKRKNKEIFHYTIYTTSDCNARCFYCFEKGIKKYPMSKQVTKDVANYIISHCGNHKVKIRWFGGEPLYNNESIDYICNTLKENGVDYESTMVSNGYLLDQDMVQKSIDLWKLSWIEITLDGTENIYNKTKSYIYKDGNAYKRVLSNIKMLVKVGITVEVRLNLNSHNANNLSELIDELSMEFCGQNKFYIHPRFLYENTGLKNDEKPEVKAMLYKKCLELEKKARDNGFALKYNLESQFRINCCMADNDTSVGILPNGDICKCEHFFEENIIGSIYNKKLDNLILDKCRQRIEAIPECETCAFLPNCYLLNICLPDLKKCNDYWRQTRLDRLKQQMLNTYNSYLKKRQLNENDETEIQC